MITKHQFLDHAATFAAGGMTAFGILGLTAPNDVFAEQWSCNDAAIMPECTIVISHSRHGAGPGHLVVRADTVGFVLVVAVVRENHTLNRCLDDITRHLATADFMALAPDDLTSVGGHPDIHAHGSYLQSAVVCNAT